MANETCYSPQAESLATQSAILEFLNHGCDLLVLSAAIPLSLLRSLCEIEKLNLSLFYGHTFEPS
jgi:hypothetical protein